MYKELKNMIKMFLNNQVHEDPVPAPHEHALQNDPAPAPVAPPPMEPTTTAPPSDEFDPLAIDPIITKKGKTKNVQKNKRP